MIKALIPAIVLASTLAAPTFALAQANGPLTRAQVRAELVQLERAGYQPGGGEDAHYPQDIQAAEARVASQQLASGGYGGTVDGSTTESGAPAHGHDSGNRQDGMPPIFSGG
jgi:Domain of unknown function (DUF4148)